MSNALTSSKSSGKVLQTGQSIVLRKRWQNKVGLFTLSDTAQTCSAFPLSCLEIHASAQAWDRMGPIRAKSDSCRLQPARFYFWTRLLTTFPFNLGVRGNVTQLSRRR